jgi:acrylyl-CoA reductase (NADPH)
MTHLPATFQAFERGVRSFASGDLPPGDLTVAVAWSSVNYKDGLATLVDGKVARISPLIPGVDLAGTVVDSDDAVFPVGSEVIAHGYEIGVARHGGFAEYARIPSDWAVPRPAGLDLRQAMMVGTAGFTAALSIVQLEARGLEPTAGPVVVTGATGGVGRTAVAILAERGYEVWAATGKDDAHAELIGLGAAGILTRAEVTAESARPLERERWAAAVDCVGAATLPYILRTLRWGGAVAASGNTGGAAFSTTVFPFILRGAAILGIDSAQLPIDERRALWERIASDLRPRQLGDAVTEVRLEELEVALDGILAGRARGRWIVRLR